MCAHTFSVIVTLVVVTMSCQVRCGIVKTLTGNVTYLNTGLLYTLHHRDLNGPITYVQSNHVTRNKAESQDHMLVVRTTEEYQPGGSLRASTYFALQDRDGGNYKLFNIELGGPVTYKPAEYMPKNKGSYVDDTLFVKDHVNADWSHYTEGGQWEASTYFGLDHIGEGWFKLIHKERVGPVTYDPASNAVENEDGSSDNVLVIRGASNALGDKYAPGGEWEGSTIFKFVPARYELTATISQFMYSDLVFSSEMTDESSSTTSEVIWERRNDAGIAKKHDVRETITFANTAEVTFEKSDTREFFQSQSDVDVEVRASFAFTQKSREKRVITWDKSETSLKDTRMVQLDDTVVNVSRVVVVPPRALARVVVYVTYSHVTIPFTAIASVSAVADQLIDDGTLAKTMPINADRVKALLHILGYEGRFDVVGGGVTVPMNGHVRVKRAVHSRTEVMFI